MSKEDKKIWLINEQGQKFYIYETEKCDMEKELNEVIQRLQEENKELMKLKKDHNYSVDVVRENTKLRYELHNSVSKNKIENELEIATKKYKDYKKELENNPNLSMQTWKHYGEKCMCEKLLGIEKNIVTLD